MSSRHMRMGPVTVLTFLILLVLAAMAVLEASTVNAQNAIDQRQRQTVTATYRNEASGQAFLSCLDAVLAEADDDQAAWEAARAAFDDAAAVQKAIDAPCRDMGMQPSLVTDAHWEGEQLVITFQSDGFRQLTTSMTPALESGRGQRYVVTQWNAETIWEEEEGTGLWTGK